MRRRESGSASIELAVLTPAVIAFFAAVVTAGRITLALQSADSAAYDASRTASLARNPTAARAQALSAATASFTAQGITCRSVTVTVDTSGFSVPVGQPATVRVTVTCVAELRDVAMPGLPGSATLTSSFVSPLDRYRSRT